MALRSNSNCLPELRFTTTQPCSCFDRSPRVLASIPVHHTDSILPRTSIWPRFSIICTRSTSCLLKAVGSIPCPDLVELHKGTQFHLQLSWGPCHCQIPLAI